MSDTAASSPEDGPPVAGGADPPATADGPSDADLLAFARAWTTMAERVHQLVPASTELAGRVREHLGVDPAELPSVGEHLPTVERPNLQLALDRLTEGQPDAEVIGLSPEIAHYGGFSLAAMLAGRFRGPSEPVPPSYDQVPVGVDRNLRCVSAGLWLLRHDGEPVVIGLAPREGHGPPGTGGLRVEVFAERAETAQATAEVLGELRREVNVYRGQVLGFSHGEYGDFGLRFLERPTVTAAQVILADGLLASIERHSVGVGDRAAELAARGQHLRRGLLLYGPPGTGKTHTIGHLMAAMPDRTTVVLQGPSVGALGQAAAIVRALPPAMLVIEDIDLIASERFMGGMEGSNPLMFQLLNEMDGLSPTDDVLFVLTTNRVDVLESALVARPGRIDHAVEIGLPDDDGRRRLLELYLEPTGHTVGDLDAIVERTAGVTASFIKELVRRAVHLGVDAGREVDDAILGDAVTDLLDGTVPAVRAALGVVDGDEVHDGRGGPHGVSFDDG
ncbi:MAG: ATP-binding protein [Actinomycetota bacterium]